MSRRIWGRSTLVGQLNIEQFPSVRIFWQLGFVLVNDDRINRMFELG